MTLLPQPTSPQKLSRLSQPQMPLKKIIVYYFHRNKRCKTCKNIESYTHEAVQKGFAGELADGSVE